MNTKSIFKVIVSGEKGPRIAGRVLLGVILVATLLITVAIVYSRAENQQIAADISAVGNPLASNPELNLAHRYAAAQDPMPGQASLAANPELALARRHAAVPQSFSGQVNLAANPELSLARRYAAVKKPATFSLLEAYREQAFARHNGIDQDQAAIQAYLSANPEVALARRIMSDQSGK